MELSKGVAPQSSNRRSVWVIALVIILASAVGGWWLAEPTSADNASQILATAPPAVNAAASAKAP